jgi:hypothetical protein
MPTPLQLELKTKRRLPKPKGDLVVVLQDLAVEREKIPGRVYVTKEGVEVPWLDDRNPRLWLGQNEDED